jgi:hypothetical protein
MCSPVQPTDSPHDCTLAHARTTLSVASRTSDAAEMETRSGGAGVRRHAVEPQARGATPPQSHICHMSPQPQWCVGPPHIFTAGDRDVCVHRLSRRPYDAAHAAQLMLRQQASGVGRSFDGAARCTLQQLQTQGQCKTRQPRLSVYSEFQFEPVLINPSPQPTPTQAYRRVAMRVCGCCELKPAASRACMRAAGCWSRVTVAASRLVCPVAQRQQRWHLSARSVNASRPASTC